MNQRYMVAGLAVGAMGLIVYMLKKSSSQTLNTAAVPSSSGGVSGLLSSLLGGVSTAAKADVVSIKPYPVDVTATNAPASSLTAVISRPSGIVAALPGVAGKSHFLTRDNYNALPSQTFITDAATNNRLDGIQAFISSNGLNSAEDAQRIKDQGWSRSEIAAASGYFTGDIAAKFASYGVAI